MPTPTFKSLFTGKITAAAVDYDVCGHLQMNITAESMKPMEGEREFAFPVLDGSREGDRPDLEGKRITVQIEV